MFITPGVATAGNHGNNGGSHGAAVANSNGIRSLDRDWGLERAAERRDGRSLSTKLVKKARARK